MWWIIYNGFHRVKSSRVWRPPPPKKKLKPIKRRQQRPRKTKKNPKFRWRSTLFQFCIFISDTLQITVFSWHSLLQVFCISLVPPLTLSCTTSCPGSSAKPSGRPCVAGYLSPTPGAPTSPPTAPPVRGTWATAKCPSVALLEGSPWRKRNRRLQRAQLRTVENAFIFGIRTLLSCYIKIVKFTLFNPV